MMYCARFIRVEILEYILEYKSYTIFKILYRLIYGTWVYCKLQSRPEIKLPSENK